jgi:chemosensory pili system protein ChpA (sensor histidine kinase/response regulator)
MTRPDDAAFLLSVFAMEAWDTVATIEASLAEVGGPTAPSVEDVAPLRIVAHRLKGAAGLHGFARVAARAGEMEVILEAAPWPGPGERVRAVGQLAARLSWIKEALDAITAGGQEPAEDVVAPEPAAEGPAAAPGAPAPLGGATDVVLVPLPLAAAAEREAPDATSVAEAPALPARAIPAASSAAVGEVQRFLADNPDIAEFFGVEAAEHIDTMTQSLLALERAGSGPTAEILGGFFRAVHTLKGAAYTVGCRPVGDLAHRVEDALVGVREGSLPLTAALVQEVFEAVDAFRLMLGLTERPAAPAPAAPVAAPTATPAPAGRPARATIRISLDRLDSLTNVVGELVVARNRLDRRLGEFERLGQQHAFNRLRLTETVRDFESKHSDPRIGGDHPAPAEPVRDGISVREIFDELEFDRYDDFNLLARRMSEISADVSEVHGQLSSLIRAVREDGARIQRLIGELRGTITRARMVPIGGLFKRLARQVREAARASGKAIALEIDGEAVEIDNAIIDEVADPLMHLIQNAISHGMETPDVRRAHGKPPEGTIRLGASLQGGLILLTVEDDGAGIDVGHVKAQAVAQGFLDRAAAAALPAREALDLIFLPGLSTAGVVTEASGRGVGLDVVRTNIRRLNGEITVETQRGRGTRFTITAPVAVVVADALMVRAGGESLAIPLNVVQTMTRVAAGVAEGSAGPALDDVEVIRVDDALGLPRVEGGRAVPLLVLRLPGRPVAIAVDELLGKEEIAIKPLPAFLEGAGPFAGATVSGEGRVILLVDPGRLVAGYRAGRLLPARPDRKAAQAGLPVARRVLLVDDSISVRKVVGAMLERGGFAVVTAGDGVEALDALARGPVDVVVTDLEMPRLNGYELVEDLRRRPALRHVPVVMLTTRAGERHREVARRLGVAHYVTKPVDEETFVRLIASVTGSATAGEPSEVALGEAVAR